MIMKLLAGRAAVRFFKHGKRAKVSMGILPNDRSRAGGADLYACVPGQVDVPRVQWRPRGTPPLLMVMALKNMSMRWQCPCHVLPGTESSDVNTLWIHCEYIVNTLWIHCEYIVNTLWIHCEYIVNTLWIHCEYIVNTLWIHCGYIVNTLWIHCAQSVQICFTLYQWQSWCVVISL